ncbi:MAG TPA: anti-sigma factor [Kofleriaceae bacterium]|nr:anti-sigma factor [Kofleriaceae bacterium]
MTRSDDRGTSPRATTPRAAHPRAHDLLADRALHGLDDADAHELHALGADADLSYDLAAAAVDLATLPIELMPADVADRILAAAGDRIIAARQPHTLAGWVMPSMSPPSMSPPSMSPPGMRPSGFHATEAPPRSMAHASSTRPRRRSAAVTFATAASLIALVGVSWWLLRGRAAPTAAAARAELLASASDVATLAWQPKEAAGASGDVVWSSSAQRGFMRFVGLPPNDPAKSQYQLWIFDRQRDQAFPVDGGVFDVSSTGEVVVAITAKLRVDDATLFAVTVERPGGVVVSKREHIAVLAPRG